MLINNCNCGLQRKGPKTTFYLFDIKNKTALKLKKKEKVPNGKPINLHLKQPNHTTSNFPAQLEFERTY